MTVVVGTDLNDTLSGTDSIDTMSGLAGDDRIYGLNDRLKSLGRQQQQKEDGYGANAHAGDVALVGIACKRQRPEADFHLVSWVTRRCSVECII